MNDELEYSLKYALQRLREGLGAEAVMDDLVEEMEDIRDKQEDEAK